VCRIVARLLRRVVGQHHVAIGVVVVEVGGLIWQLTQVVRHLHPRHHFSGR
jgi:hypothetical protein